MSTSALDIITGAAKLLGVVFKSEALDADEANDGLVTLNDMLDSWSNDSLRVTAFTVENFALTSAASYTIGSGGNFNTSRPITVKSAVVRVGSIDYPLRWLSVEEYQTEVIAKAISTTIPRFAVYDNAYPLATLTFYAVPSGGTFYLQSKKPLANLSALNSTVDLPPGWKKALKYNLAIDLAPQYGAQVAPEVAEGAAESLGLIKHAVLASTPMHLLDGSVNDGNIYSGYWS